MVIIYLSTLYAGGGPAADCRDGNHLRSLKAGALYHEGVPWCGAGDVLFHNVDAAEDDLWILRIGELSDNHGVYGTAHPLPRGHLCVGTYRKAYPEFVRGNGRRGDWVCVAKMSAEQAVGGRDHPGL